MKFEHILQAILHHIVLAYHHIPMDAVSWNYILGGVIFVLFLLWRRAANKARLYKAVNKVIKSQTLDVTDVLDRVTDAHNDALEHITTIVDTLVPAESN